MPPPLICAAIACTRCGIRPSGSPSTTRGFGFSSSITPGAITALAAYTTPPIARSGPTARHSASSGSIFGSRRPSSATADAVEIEPGNAVHHEGDRRVRLEQRTDAGGHRRQRRRLHRHHHGVLRPERLRDRRSPARARATGPRWCAPSARRAGSPPDADRAPAPIPPRRRARGAPPDGRRSRRRHRRRSAYQPPLSVAASLASATPRRQPRLRASRLSSASDVESSQPGCRLPAKHWHFRLPHRGCSPTWSAIIPLSYPETQSKAESEMRQISLLRSHSIRMTPFRDRRDRQPESFPGDS